MPAYTKQIQWRFEIRDAYRISYHEHDDEGRVVAWIEEESKNSQEDCHEAGVAVYENGTWTWQEGDTWHKSFDDYGYGSAPVLEYLNANPLPQEFFDHAKSMKDE